MLPGTTTVHLPLLQVELLSNYACTETVPRSLNLVIRLSFGNPETLAFQASDIAMLKITEQILRALVTLC